MTLRPSLLDQIEYEKIIGSKMKDFESNGKIIDVQPHSKSRWFTIQVTFQKASYGYKTFAFMNIEEVLSKLHSK